MKTISSDIIIVGAGPTGLMLAAQLTRFGIDYVILDQKPGPTDQSRALVVHARSMEIYEQMGLSDQVIASGQPNDGLIIHKNGRVAASVTIVNPGEDSTPFPYLMMYEQSKNENLLYGHLLAQDRKVEWNTHIVKIEQENDTYNISAKQEENTINYHCQYLIACDGAKSMIREFAQVPFVGGSYMNIFFVVDTHAEGGFSSAKLSLFLRKEGINVLFPLTGRNHFRVLGILPETYYHQKDLPAEAVLDYVKEGMQLPVKFYDTEWYSSYKLHHKKVTHFNKGNIFFAGDAAHVHSPAGGQGMNTGLQDVYNLAWKLALVKKGKARPSLLDTYHEERDPVAADLLSSTDRLFSFMSTDNFWFGLFRLYFIPFFIPFITRFKKVRKRMFLQVSQIKISYSASSLSKGKAGNVIAGQRLPYCFVLHQGISVSIYQMINQKNAAPFTILLYGLPEAGLEELDQEIFRVFSMEVNAANDRAFAAAGLSRSFVMIVRPDNYIGYASQRVAITEIREFFTRSYGLV